MADEPELAIELTGGYLPVAPHSLIEGTAMMSDETELVECRCPERFVDLACYGIHICRDGKRIAPKDFYAEPPEDADAAARAALSGEAR